MTGISAATPPPRWYRGLRVRLAILLAVALLPIGLIAINQTNLLSAQARDNAELALLALTEKAAAQEREVIQRGVGVANALAVLALSFEDDAESCRAYLKALVNGYPRFSFIAIVPRSGQVVCSSSGETVDISDSPGFLDHIEQAAPSFSVNADAPISGTSVVVLRQPFLDKDAVAGYALVSIPHSSFVVTDADDPSALRELITFDADGEVLTTTGDMASVSRRLPGSKELAAFASGTTQTFFDTDRAGRRQVYAVVPIEQRQIYTLGIWSTQSRYTRALQTRVPPVLFPGLMWVISLGVALFAVHTLVIRHIRNLGDQMARFSNHRELPDDATVTREMPTELQALENRFLGMAEAILRDEADLEDGLREKTVLIREVHHRVKNNLQLISSIINMQIRAADHAETRDGLRQIQERVLSLATIHRDLYQTSTAGQVDVGALIEEIVGHTADIGADSKTAEVEITRDIERIMLYPDQAVPLSLLASEAATNAMKYAGGAEGSAIRLDITLKKLSQTQVRFVFANSVGDTTEADGTGLGAQLIRAFAIQLGATTDVEQTEDRYALTVTFEIARFAEDAAHAG